MSTRTVSHYRILGPLGAGGMGVVLEAEDVRLGRRVALKFVPAELARDATSLDRLVGEARAVSALNHPHICTLFDVDQDEQGQPFLVLERLEGRTLKSAIGGRPLPVARVLEVGAQIASALGAAHAKGIVHGDVKPANVFETIGGAVKLLDFGLARSVARDAGEVAAGESDTLTGGPAAPAAAQVAGTTRYMSPEQARGEMVDARSDLFSLGAVLYEMVTGRPSFPGTTPALVLEGLLARAPVPAAELNAQVPPELDAILGKALEKDRALRYQTAADLEVDLRRALRSRPASAPPASPGARRVRPRRAPWPAALAGLAAVAALAAAAWWPRPPSPPRFTQLTFRRGIVTSARFSPDGHTVVYSALWDGRPPEVFVRRLDGPGTVPLGLPPATLLSVSTRGELAVLMAPPGEIGTVWLGTLARVPLSGGPLKPVLEDVLDADWSPDGRDLAAIRWRDGAFQLEYPLGQVRLRPCPGTHLRVSPSGGTVALLDERDRGGLLLVERSGGVRRLEIPRAHQRLAWTADGRALLVDAGAVELRRTLRRVALDGTVTEVCALAGTLVVHDVARDGRVLLHHGSEGWRVRVRAPGETQEREAAVFANAQVQGLSADGTQVLLWDAGEGPPGAALLFPTRGGPAVRLGDGHPRGLSADGRQVVMDASDLGGPPVQVLPTGAGPAWTVPLGRLGGPFDLWHFDARGLGIDASEPGRPVRSYLVAAGDAAPRPVTPEGTLALTALQPDGRFLARGAQGDLEWRRPGEEAVEALSWKLHQEPFLETLGTGDGGRTLIVRTGSVPARIDRIALESGRREPWMTLAPDDTTGAGHVWTVLLTPDGSGRAYTHGRFLIDLFLAEGLP